MTLSGVIMGGSVPRVFLPRRADWTVPSPTDSRKKGPPVVE